MTRKKTLALAITAWSLGAQAASPVPITYRSRARVVASLTFKL